MATTNNAINLNDQGMAYYDGAGVFSAPTLTQRAPVIGDAANEIKTTAAMTDGQLLIGSTGADPVPAAITAGTGISVSNGAGSITLSTVGGGVSWQTTSVNVANMSVNNGYACIAPGGALTLGLPTTAALGSVLRVTLKGATSWQITQAAGQSIRIGSSITTTGVAGSLTSTAQGDSVEIVCIVANLEFLVLSSMGNITVA